MMSEMNLLLVEDHEQDITSCMNAVNDFMEDESCTVNVKVCSNVEDALLSLSQSYYDGAIIDMRLANEGDEGNQITEQIKNTFRRIPVVIMTGTPDSALTEGIPLVGLFKKGETKYYEIIKELWDIYKTGLTKIMGGTGFIEKSLSEIFIKNLIPYRNKWKTYGNIDSVRTEKAFLRHAISHLNHLLADGFEKCYPEEFYLYPTFSKKISTGVVLINKESKISYVAMNPACDLALRENGDCNTDRALLVEIEEKKDLFPNFDWENLSNSNKKELDKAYKNNKSGYYHFLPKTDFFKGGFLNFRRISTYSEHEMKAIFDNSDIQISSSFLKDIISRFSSYYARQGQPDIDHDL